MKLLFCFATLEIAHLRKTYGHETMFAILTGALHLYVCDIFLISDNFPVLQ